jgi:hypothetical protein
VLEDVKPSTVPTNAGRAEKVGENFDTIAATLASQALLKAAREDLADLGATAAGTSHATGYDITASTLWWDYTVSSPTFGIAARTDTGAGEDITIQCQDTAAGGGAGGGLVVILGQNAGASVPDGGSFIVTQSTFGDRLTIYSAITLQARRLSNTTVVIDSGSFFVNNDSGDTCLECYDGGAGSPRIGFLGAAAVARPTVSGARDDPEGALADLLAELATLGLITNSTTAS